MVVFQRMTAEQYKANDMAGPRMRLGVCVRARNGAIASLYHVVVHTHPPSHGSCPCSLTVRSE